MTPFHTLEPHQIYTNYFDSIKAMQQYLAADWSAAIVTDSVWAEAVTLMQDSESEIFYQEEITITRLAPIWTNSKK